MLRSILLLGAVLGAQAFTPGSFRTSWTLRDIKEHMAAEDQMVALKDTDPGLLYPEHTLDVPIDHFHNDSLYEPHTNATFKLRYWFDASYYKPGGPVIVLQGGETSGKDRLPFLQKGILAQLIQATNGLGVVLEHRYYGNSLVSSDLTPESLRFLTTDQSVADQAYFAKNIVFPGLEHLDLTAPKNAYIAYGGSYAGAFVAFLRKLYPDVYWGAIASSAVTAAIVDYWKYFEAARIYVRQDCVHISQKATDVVDTILLKHNGTEYVPRLKALFGMPNVTRNDDFAANTFGGLTGMQGLNWDPALNSTSMGRFCDKVTASTLVYDNGKLTKEADELLEVAGYGKETAEFKTQFLNYVGYIQTKVNASCSAGQTQDECFTNYDGNYYKRDDIKQSWRLWPWQYCTEWGYFNTGSGAPKSVQTIISRLVDIPYRAEVCRAAFNITTMPDVERINKHGGLNFTYPRVAFLDGEADPWRAATPHAIGQPDRPDTDEEPFIMIDMGVHHWDENGLFPNQTTASLPPKSVVHAQQREVAFVKAWMAEWNSAQFGDEL